jgi:hypothetical protein
MTPEERTERAKKAVAAREAKRRANGAFRLRPEITVFGITERALRNGRLPVKN